MAPVIEVTNNWASFKMEAVYYSHYPLPVKRTWPKHEVGQVGISHDNKSK